MKNKSGLLITLLIVFAFVSLFWLMMQRNESTDSSFAPVLERVGESRVVEGSTMLASQTFYHNLSNADNFSRLVFIAEETELVEVLQNGGPYTVFASPDVAFEEILEEDWQALKKDEEALRKLAEYHIVEGKFLFEDLENGSSLRTIQGQELFFSIDEGTLMINGHANVLAVNIVHANGVMHVIDTILVPDENI